MGSVHDAALQRMREIEATEAPAGCRAYMSQCVGAKLRERRRSRRAQNGTRAEGAGAEGSRGGQCCEASEGSESHRRRALCEASE